MVDAVDGIEPSARKSFIDALSKLVDVRAATALFDLFNQIAVLRYENMENTGSILLSRPGSPFPPLIVRLEAPVELYNVRGIRKYLQITDGQLCLVSDCNMIYGFTAVECPEPDTLTVRFRPAGVWELNRAGQVVLQVESPAHAAPARKLCQATLAARLRETFRDLTAVEIEHLCALMAAAERQLRGTNVLISADAVGEAMRLSTQCTRISPVLFTPTLMERFTSIDGTVIIDPQGVCHAIGAILDGDVAERGDRTRGGRYNSAVMYVQTTSIPSLIVVVSHDGTVDIVTSGAKSAAQE